MSKGGMRGSEGGFARVWDASISNSGQSEVKALPRGGEQGATLAWCLVAS